MTARNDKEANFHTCKQLVTEAASQDRRFCSSNGVSAKRLCPWFFSEGLPARGAARVLRLHRGQGRRGAREAVRCPVGHSMLQNAGSSPKAYQQRSVGRRRKQRSRCPGRPWAATRLSAGCGVAYVALALLGAAVRALEKGPRIFRHSVRSVRSLRREPSLCMPRLCRPGQRAAGLAVAGRRPHPQNPQEFRS